MTIYLLWLAIFDGDDHPSPMLLSHHLTEQGARDAAVRHVTENPTLIRRAYSKERPNQGRWDGDVDTEYLITTAEVLP